ncbi:hypothetical protein [Nocardia carnea]|uniref:hypothetical protein n=1 Tax=Nocardia carnea TaxID=37328 RepID=UPI0024543D65|nr:hypothetical protein [Nocardia carnea]
MKPRTFTAAAALLVAFTATACDATPAPDPRPSGERCPAAGFTTPYEHIDPCSADAVLQAAVTAIFDYRPAEDTDPRAAFTRARPLLQDRFATQAAPAAAAWAPITTNQRQRWRDHQTPITTTVIVTGDDHPTDTAATADRVLAVHIQPAHEPAVVFTVYASATRIPGGPWLLSELGARS